MEKSTIGSPGRTDPTRVRSNAASLEWASLKWASQERASLSPATFRWMLVIGLAVTLSTPQSAQAVLDILVNETGKVSISADGAGSTAVSTTIQVEKPNAAASVRSAFLSCASLGGRVIRNGDISLDTNPVNFSASVIADSPFAFNNVFGEVTAFVKPRVDAAPPGLVSFEQSEVASSTIDGCALYVIFDNPSAPDSTIFVLFGSQTSTGDSFDVTLAEPLDPENDTAEMGLAISFSFQGSMVSSLDVNGSRLTSSAGGQDDGVATDGALITVGGIGDTNENPPPLVDTPTSTRFDDELYNLLPFVESGVTSIRIDTRNPSNDDNIFAGHMVFSGLGIEGEGILLAPREAANFIGTSDAITATVVNDSGVQVAGRLVDFSVDSGPNAGQTSDPGQGECAPNSDCTTDSTGRVTWTYTSNGIAGTDVITATFTTNQGAPLTSSPATKSWLASGTPVVDNNDPECVSLSVDGSQGFGFATDNVPSEDSNGNGFLDPGEDANENGLIDVDSGIATVALVGESSNLTVNFSPDFAVGDPDASFVVELVNANLPGDGTVSVTDDSGNACVYNNIVIAAICVPDVVCNTGLAGVCADGGTSCDETGISTCVATTQPGELAEVCDSADNNCDGAVDEGLDVMTTCGAGLCAASGVITCIEGSEQPDTCEPIAGVVEQTECGVGQCASLGVIACKGGAEQMDTCVAGDPGPEICDDLDNNCNDSIDECCPSSESGTEGCPVCSDLLLVEGSETEYMGTATDTLGISLVAAPSESNLTVMPHFVPGDSVAEFTVGIDDMNSPAGGVLAAIDTEGLVCFFDPVDFPTAVGGGTTSTWSEGVRLAGNLAYVLDEVDGLSIFDLANLESSGHQLLGTLQANTTECPNGVFYDDMEVRGTTVIIAGGICGLIIADVSDPAEPFVIATLDTMGEAEDAVFGSNGRVYLADFFRGLVVVDVSNTSEPTVIAVVETSNDSFAAVSAFGEQSLPLLGSPVSLFPDEDRNLLHVATTRGLFIIDIDPARPGFPVIGSFDANPDDGASQQQRNARTPQDVASAGDFAYLSVAQAGLLIIDVSNPSNPQPVGNPVTTVQIFYKLSISESRLFVGEGSCGVAVFQIVGSELREVLGSPFPIEGSAVDCSHPSVSDTFAWSLDDLSGRVIVGTGILSPGSGGFQFIDFTESLGMPVPEPDSQWMFAVAIASLVTLRRRRNAAACRRRG